MRLGPVSSIQWAGIFVLSVVHTFGYQVIVERVDPMTPITAVVVVLTIGIQGWGFLKYQSLVSGREAVSDKV